MSKTPMSQAKRLSTFGDQTFQSMLLVCRHVTSEPSLLVFCSHLFNHSTFFDFFCSAYEVIVVIIAPKFQCCRPASVEQLATAPKTKHELYTFPA